MNSLFSVLTVLVQDGVAIITCPQLTTMTLVGTSGTTSVPAGMSGLRTIMITSNPGEEAVVALIMESTGGKFRNQVCGLISLHWEKNKLIVEKDGNFMPPKDRLAQVLSSGELRVTSQGQVFTTGEPKDHARKVADPNLLCQYLVGQVSFRSLEAISFDPRAGDQVRIWELQDRLSEARNKIRDLEGEIRGREKTIADLKQINGGVWAENRQLRKPPNKTLGSRFMRLLKLIFRT